MSNKKNMEHKCIEKNIDYFKVFMYWVQIWFGFK
jgi:hypothetical protein